MPLADNPIQHIVHMFKMEMKARPDHHCIIHHDGIKLDDLPLDDDELVIGVYKERFFFTPKSLFWKNSGGICSFQWKEVKFCSTEHGCGESISKIILLNGTTLSVPLGELSKGWAGPVGQLYHAMINRWRVSARNEHFVMEIEDFFKSVDRDDAIAPNWFPDHPGLLQTRNWLEQLRQVAGMQSLYLVVTDYDDGYPCVQEIAMVCTDIPSSVALEKFRFSYVGPSSARTRELTGSFPDGLQIISGVWD